MKEESSLDSTNLYFPKLESAIETSLGGAKGLTHDISRPFSNGSLYNSNVDSPQVSVPNPKRANAIDFIGLSENPHLNGLHSSIYTPPHSSSVGAGGSGNNDRFGSSFSHLSAETKNDLSALGVHVSRAKSSDAPTPNEFHFPSSVGQWQQYEPSPSNRSPFGENNSRAAVGIDLSNSFFNGNDSSTFNTGNILSGNNNREWPFVDKPPGLISRATSSLGITMSSLNDNHNNNVLSALTRPLSTPIYLNKSNNDTLNLGGLGFDVSSSSHPFINDDQGPINNDSALINQINSLQTKTYSPFGSDLNLVSHQLSLSTFPTSLALADSNERWPKPVRYGRPMESSLLGSSILRPHSSTDPMRSSGLSPLSSQGQLSISPKPPVDRLGHNNENKQQSSVIPTHSREITPPPTSSSARISPKLTMNALDDRAIENVIATNCHHILLDAAEHSLKAVELANTLRARVGTEVLAIVREKWGGLLSLLERHPDKFLVERIPKNDRVSLHNVNNNSGSNSNIILSTLSDLTAGSLPSPQHSNDHLSFGLYEVKDSGNPVDLDHVNTVVDGQQASRCLHVGNVPSSYTEVQLVREFEKFGQIDGLKLITQKNGNRRFAFVTYKTISQAITARHCLSKLHPWKSAISFAHRDFGKLKSSNDGDNNNAVSFHHHAHTGSVNHSELKQYRDNNASEYSNVMNSNFSNNLHQKASEPSSRYGNTHTGLWNTKEAQNPFEAALSLSRPMQHSQQQHDHLHHQVGNNQHFRSQQQSYHHPHPQHQQQPSIQHSASQYSQPLNRQTLSTSNSGTYNASSSHFTNYSQSSSASHPSQAQQHTSSALQSHHPPLIGTHPAIENFPDKNALQIIINRLCDDTYVPTQPWPVDVTSDLPVCQAVIDQVNHFGGSTTISKLRGFLKHRVGTTDNIKSVPLKALLFAYPNFFKVDGNLVILVSSTV
jgi:hypothetical protein